MRQLKLEPKEIKLLYHCLRAWNANTYDNLADVNDLLCKSPDNTWLNEFREWLENELELGTDLETHLARFLDE